ncbi:hypothetical protein Gpo141_00008592 [Globisporangium polare]
MHGSCSRDTGAQLYAADHRLQAGVAVLTARPLWDLITSFMTGYPHVVYKFDQESDPSTLRDACDVWGPVQFYLGYSLARRAALPNLAIAANNVEILPALFKLSMHPQYQDDPKLRFKKSFRCAALFNNLRALEFLDANLPKGPDWQWDPNLLQIAMKVNEPDLQVLDWIDARVPRGPRASYVDYHMVHQASYGNLDHVRWLVEHEYEISQQAVNAAAEVGRLEVLRYLYAHSSVRCSLEALNRAATKGFTNIVQLIVENQSEDVSHDVAINGAAEHGQLEVVRFFIENNIRVDERSLVIDVAAMSGHLEIIKYLHEKRPQGCPGRALGEAAAYGHLEIVKFLYQHRTKGREQEAFSRAVQNGHLEVVRFLHEQSALERPLATGDEVVATGSDDVETVPLDASCLLIDVAAANGHLEVVKYLHENYSHECSHRAMSDAAANGHLDVVEFLHENRTEGCAPDTLDCAARKNHLEVVKFLREVYSLECSASAFDDVVANCSLALVKELISQRQNEGCSAEVIMRALTNGRSNVVRFLIGFPIQGDVVALLTCAASHSTVRLVRQFHSRLQEGESAYEAIKGAVSREDYSRYDIIRFLCQNQEREAVSFLKQAVAKSDLVVAKCVRDYSNVGELVEAEKSAIEHGELEIAEHLARHIEARTAT